MDGRAIMQVAKIAHASIVVSVGDLRCFMDPVLVSPYENGANVFDPEVELDHEQLLADGNLIVITHEHMDHFSPRSLNLFDRSVHVIFPKGAPLIERALAHLGFENRTAAEIGQEIDVGDAVLIPTPSRVPFAEMGMVFKTPDHVFWNLCDSLVDEKAIGAIRKVVGRPPDLLFTAYQPLLEGVLDNALGQDFPFDDYTRLLKFAWAIRPRHVGMIACGFRYTREWLNDRGFPITEKQFAHDIQRGAPDMNVVHVPHGAVVDLARDCAVEIDALPGVKRIGPLYSSYDWRPERGVPPLQDRNPFGHGLAMLREESARYLDQNFLGPLEACDPTWLDRMARLEVIWRLEVVFPDGTSSTRLLDLAKRPLAWQPDDREVFVKMATSITASGLVGILRGEHNGYSLAFNEIRAMHRLYEVYPGGAVKNGNFQDEPLIKILNEGASERHLEAELARIAAES